MKQTDRRLENTHLSDVQDYLKEHADSIMRFMISVIPDFF